MAARKVYYILLIMTAAAAFFAIGLFHAPQYLVHSTNYAKADALVVFLGPVFHDRERYALDLMRQRKADCLIVPAQNRFSCFSDGVLKTYPGKPSRFLLDKNSPASLPGYYEDTHLELIAARKIMAVHGLQSAIFVSSPYHMRRIQMMVDREFKKGPGYYFLPTPYEAAPLLIWDLKTSDWKKVRREYLKILWFQMYSIWAPQHS